MIIEYHRPETMEAALELLSRKKPATVPLGGGSSLNRPSPIPLAVVDLQSLKLDRLEERGQWLHVGATVRLQTLMDADDIQQALKDAIRHEATYNLRHMATVAGRLVAGDGRSPFATAMLALDARLKTESKGAEASTIRLGDLLPLRAELLKGRLISEVILPSNARLEYRYVARTPADKPVVCVAVAQWPSKRTRVVVGGWGDAPRLALDGPSPDGADLAAQNACYEAQDEWASAAYRSDVAPILVKRCLETFSEV
ncbi:MAG: FAD binding domain-containing protein [Chloroflexota bacterium]